MSCSHCRPVLKLEQHDMCQLRAISQTRLLVCRRLPPLEAFDAIVCANVDIQVAPIPGWE